jgi:hypothetical protein
MADPTHPITEPGIPVPNSYFLVRCGQSESSWRYQARYRPPTQSTGPAVMLGTWGTEAEASRDVKLQAILDGVIGANIDDFVVPVYCVKSDAKPTLCIRCRERVATIGVMCYNCISGPINVPT